MLSKIKKLSGSFFIFILLFFISYATLTALWKNTETTIAQSSFAPLFLSNVFAYFLTVNKHLASLFFTLPISFFGKPVFLLYVLAAIIALAALGVKFKKYYQIILKSGIILGLILVVVFLALNYFSLENCVKNYQGCLISKMVTPLILGIYFLLICTILPFLSTFNSSKRFSFKLKKLIIYTVCLNLFFVFSWYVAIYLPLKKGIEMARTEGEKIAQQRYIQTSTGLQLLEPTFLPIGLSKKIAQYPTTGITTLYGCEESNSEGLTITQEKLNLDKGNFMGELEESLKQTPNTKVKKLSINNFPAIFAETHFSAQNIEKKLIFLTPEVQVTINYSSRCPVDVSETDLIKIGESLK